MNDDDLDTGLREWGAAQRDAAGGPVIPPIADLLTGRRRRHNLAAIAASVVLVAAIAVGLTFGLHVGSTPTASPVESATTSNSDTKQPCSQQFDVVVDQVNKLTAKGTVVLRYLGARVCTILTVPEFAFIDRHNGEALKPSLVAARFEHSLVLRPGEGIQFGLSGFAGCYRSPAGQYDLAVFLRRTANPQSSRGASAVLGPVDVRRSPGATFDCGASQPIQAGAVEVLRSARSVTLAELSTFARQSARLNGDPSATVIAVRSTYGRASALIPAMAGDPTESNSPTWIVELTGHFECNTCKMAPLSKPLYGTHMIYAFYLPQLQVSDFDFATHADLSKLGHVVQLIP